MSFSIFDGALGLGGGSAQGLRRPLSHSVASSLPPQVSPLWSRLHAQALLWPHCQSVALALRGGISCSRLGVLQGGGSCLREQDAPAEGAVRRSLRAARAPWKTVLVLSFLLQLGKLRLRGERVFARVA